MNPELAKQNAAAVEAWLLKKPIEARTIGDTSWTELKTAEPSWRFDYMEYRPKPEPVSVPWSSPSDVPLGCWIRHNGHGDMFLCHTLQSNGIGFGSEFREWIHTGDLLHSIDGLKWKPCTYTP